MNRIYFDNAATSFPKARHVSRAVSDMLEFGAFNVGRGGYEEAYALSERVLDTRDLLVRLFSVPQNGAVCFTSGVTQSINQFLKGTLRPGDHVIVSSMEHNAVMRPLCAMQKDGVELSVAKCAPDGTLEPTQMYAYFQKNTKAVVCTHASNVCGTILPIGEIGAICHDRGIFFAVDAAQTAGVIPVNMQSMYIDFLAFSGHKGLRGPQGVGGFAVSQPLAAQMKPLIEGGTGSRSDSEEQPDFLPDKYESGTLPLPAIVGLRQALIVLEEDGIEDGYRREMEMTALFLKGLEQIPQARVAGIAESSSSQRLGVVSVDFSPLDNATLAFALEQEYGIMTRVGLHCAPRAHQTLGTFPQGAVRFSFGPENTLQEINQCLQAIKYIFEREN
ncbi:MAG: aminotransferase class V-fold PLP-dependent enzyme [Oscillospiraceae bacterium]